MLPGEIVKKSNALARARWSPDSVWEMRLVALIAAKIKPWDTDFQTYEIAITDIIGNNPGGKDYKDIEKAVDKAISRVITLRNGEDWKKYTLFSSCEFNSKKGTLKVGFHPDLKEHYLQLKQYMQYNLLEFMLLPSTYSQRLFEFLKSWDDKPEITVSLSDLHEMLETPKSLREKYKDFRVRVLDKAHEDILKNTGFEFNWEPIKKGRAVSGIKFTFTKKSKKPVTAGPKATALLRETLGIEPPKENNTHNLFLEFTKKFVDVGSKRIEAWKVWNALNETGNAPSAQDVPENNQLAIIAFLTKWQEAHTSGKADE